MTNELTPQQKLCKLTWAENELKRVRDQITPAIAPQTAKSVRATLKSLQGAIRHAKRMARVETTVDASGILVWTPAKVGCYWNSGPYTIATHTVVNGARHSDYVAYFKRRKIGIAGTLDGAQHLAQCAHNFRVLEGKK